MLALIFTSIFFKIYWGLLNHVIFYIIKYNYILRQNQWKGSIKLRVKLIFEANQIISNSCKIVKTSNAETHR